jgi:flagellar motor switch protein FliM
MSPEFVSREETDLLLNGVVRDAPPNAATSGETPSTRPDALLAQERIERGHMPGLDLVHERFARLAVRSLSEFMRRRTEVAAQAARFLRYREFVDELAPGPINVVRVKPLGTTLLFVFEAALMASVIDSLFGGTGRALTAPAARDPTPTEQRLIERLLELLFASYEQAWAALHPVSLEYLRTETSPRLAAIAAPNERVIAASFEVALGAATGRFHVCMPYQPLEPLRNVLYSSRPDAAAERDRQPLDKLAGQVQLAEVELVARLASAPATLRQVLDMHPGEIIPIEIQEHIVAHVDGVPIVECNYGVHNGQYALKIVRWITAPAQALPTGDTHV